MPIRVGVKGSAYSLVRNVTNLPFENAKIVRTYDAINAIAFAKRRLFGDLTGTSFLNNFHMDLGINRVDILHFFNSISLTRSPWVVTFEHYLPRWNADSRFGLQLLARPQCKKIIAMSRFALRYQQEHLKEHGDVSEPIMRKLTVMLPPQRSLVNEYEEKPLRDSVVTLAFVGNDFFRKGGREVVRAVIRLAKEHYPVHLTIASEMGYGDYASHATIDDLKETLQLIGSHSDIITFHRHIPNDDVIRLFRDSHVALLPTYDDTFGYSVLEAQAAACPVITTDVCALSEINNDSVGWVISVPKNDLGIAQLQSVEQRKALSEQVEEDLVRNLRAICEKPEQIKEKGLRAAQRVREEHNPRKVAVELEAIYLDGLRN